MHPSIYILVFPLLLHRFVPLPSNIYMLQELVLVLFLVKSLIERGSIWRISDFSLLWIFSRCSSSFAEERRFGFPGLRFVAISHRWCRSVLPVDMASLLGVLEFGYAGGDGGSNLFQHVGDMSKACKVVVYGSSAAVRRPSSLWTVSLWFFGGLTSTVFRFSVLDRHQMSMRIRCLFLIERLRFVACVIALFVQVWRLSIWSLEVSTSPILASFGVGGNCTCRFLASYSDHRELATSEATREVSASEKMR
ncbi:hypothetical protein YC2023_074132 [Brassica napus]